MLRDLFILGGCCCCFSRSQQLCFRSHGSAAKIGGRGTKINETQTGVIWQRGASPLPTHFTQPSIHAGSPYFIHTLQQATARLPNTLPTQQLLCKKMIIIINYKKKNSRDSASAEQSWQSALDFSTTDSSDSLLSRRRTKKSAGKTLKWRSNLQPGAFSSCRLKVKCHSTASPDPDLTELPPPPLLRCATQFGASTIACACPLCSHYPPLTGCGSGAEQTH